MSVDRKFLRYADLKAAGVPWSRMHIDRLERAGKFPKRVHLGPGTVAWLESEILGLVDNAMNARQSEVRFPELAVA